MTLPEMKESMQIFNSKSKWENDIGELLKECIYQSVEEKRITCGVFDCAKLLKSNPENVMICVLPEAESENISIHIQHTLIEAFCWENDIRILKVKNQQSVGNILCGEKEKNVTDENSAMKPDISCLMIEYSGAKMSSEDQGVIWYHESIIMNTDFPKPVIHLPD
ncbi:hypothetical protein LOTGIDRAFT_165742 [Lottia gigantea]|uniref:Ribosomal protein eL8/eL30/eS12/Gadd45 domain-containing protein n=1 Tax=Lottia gigantea TaxID=225164 RepID=V4A4W1_LOTGI|nr:hypothetical protein LOTGIDRAFT_165742 [Lottia gigantea]ESO88301.1 hypothetical protein LOTGIDRAFT_165742 [Lottia gigantea]